MIDVSKCFIMPLRASRDGDEDLTELGVKLEVFKLV